MDITCGVFIINNKKELLVVHATNSPWTRWSIPKGMPDADEYYINAAKREVKEETNIDLADAILVEVGEAKYPKTNKKLIAYYIQINSYGSEYDLKCTSTFIHKHSGRELPENDSIEWMNIEAAKRVIHSTQLELLNFLIHG
jgi:8-oxo-dGTP pyrophosphatase MutT (NUDIX family)